MDNRQEHAGIDDIDGIDRKIIKIKVENPSISLEVLAKEVGICRENVTKRLNKDGVQQAIKDVQQTALDMLLEAQTEAAQKMIELSRSKDERIALQAAKEVLKGVLSDSQDLTVNKDLPTEIVIRHIKPEIE